MPRENWQVEHILRRAAFGPSAADLARFGGVSPTAVVDHLVNYERQLDSAFALYHSLGLDAIKSGYVTDTTPEGNSHHSQFMVRHYRKVIETAAKYHIMMDVHEPIHDTGERRTYPNWMSREGAAS